ncbi:hypothetical protein TI39_contig417g00002 [Zymoseptoria brevis]|uniref:Telomeric single stranded DNA binding POT1/Cdc13 domain-containing protein n=1 Tax=Zymoseptoria brevis TaxID=1047168 RepID=A0A0F4GQ50_9PEZI|nr:hypothetical protein TI39_contig417g00002 [Zymoseptoria brevis]
MATPVTTQVPIPDLDPSVPPPPNTSIHAIITILWPYSSATRSLALLLASPDVRLRREGGQVRVRFTGRGASAIAKARLGIGDEVLLELEGGRWSGEEGGGSKVRTPGKRVQGELVFGGRVGVRVLRRSGFGTGDEELGVGEDGWVRVDEEEEEEEVGEEGRKEEERVRDRTPVAKRGRVAEVRSSLGIGGGQVYASPAFARRARMSAGEDVGDLSASDPFIDAYWEEGSPRKKMRLSFSGVGRWRLEGRDRSPQKETDDDMEIDREVEELISGSSPSHMPPPRLAGLDIAQTLDAAQSFAGTGEQTPTTPKLHPVPASNLPLPSPFPSQPVQLPWESQPTSALPASLVTALDQPELPLADPLVAAVSENTTQESSLPDTDSQPFLEIPSQDAGTTQTSRPSLAYTESAPESSNPDSQTISTGVYAIGHSPDEDGTYRSQMEHPELLSDTEEDDNMYDEELRDRARGIAREGSSDDEEEVEVVDEDDVEEVIDDMGEEPESSDDDDEEEDEEEEDDDEEQEWEDDETIDVQSEEASTQPTVVPAFTVQDEKDSTMARSLHQPQSIVIDDSEDDEDDLIVPDRPTDVVSQTAGSDQRASVQAVEPRSLSQTVELIDGVVLSDKLAPEQPADPKEAIRAIQAAGSAKTATPKELAPARESSPAETKEVEPNVDLPRPLAPSAKPATAVAKLQLSQQRSAQPETPIKAIPGIFGRQSAGSAISTPGSTPQSERDRIMAKTYSSLFGFGAAKPAQPTSQTPTPNAGDLPKRSFNGWGGRPIMKIPDATDTSAEEEKGVVPTKRSERDAVEPPKAVDQAGDVQDKEADTLKPPMDVNEVETDENKKTEEHAQIVPAPDTVMEDALEAPLEPDALSENAISHGSAADAVGHNIEMKADHEDDPSEDIADVLPMPTKLQNIPPPQPPPSSAPPRPSQPVQVVDLGSSDAEDEEDEVAMPRGTASTIPQDGENEVMIPTFSGSKNEMATDESGVSRSKAETQTRSREDGVEVQPGSAPEAAVPFHAEDGMDFDDRAGGTTSRADARQSAIETSAARLEDLVRGASQGDVAEPQSDKGSVHSIEGLDGATEVETLSHAEELSPVAPSLVMDNITGSLTTEIEADDAATSAKRASVIDMSDSQELETSVTTTRSVTASQVRTRRAAALSNEQSPHPALLPTPEISYLRSQASLRPSANKAVLPPTPELSQGDSLSNILETESANPRPTTPEPLSRRTRAGSRASLRASVEPATTQPRTPNRRSNRKSQAQSQISEEAIDEVDEDTIAVYTPSPKKTAVAKSTRKSRAQTSEKEIEMIQESELSPEKGSPPHKSLTSRLSTVPDAISAWFTPRRSTRQQVSEAPGSSQPHGLSTPIGYYHPLSALPQKLNPSSQSYADNTLDVLAVVSTATSNAERAKSGPRDYYTTFRVWDPSLSKSSTDSILVEVFRPWHATLPVAEVGDGILLRGFAVKSRKRNPYLLSTDASGWCVWRYGEDGSGGEKQGRTRSSFGAVGGAREEVKGPPVEVGKEERKRVEELRDGWVELGQEK